MNIDDLSKEELIKYKKLLSELKNHKLYRNISASLSLMSMISFVYFSNNDEFKKMVISALITIIGLNFIGYNTREIKYAKEKIRKMKE